MSETETIEVKAVVAVWRNTKSGFSKFEGKKKRQQADRVSAVRSIFRKTVAQAGKCCQDGSWFDAQDFLTVNN